MSLSFFGGDVAAYTVALSFSVTPGVDSSR